MTAITHIVSQDDFNKLAGDPNKRNGFLERAQEVYYPAIEGTVDMEVSEELDATSGKVALLLSDPDGFKRAQSMIDIHIIPQVENISMGDVLVYIPQDIYVSLDDGKRQNITDLFHPFPTTILPITSDKPVVMTKMFAKEPISSEEGDRLNKALKDILLNIPEETIFEIISLPQVQDLQGKKVLVEGYSKSFRTKENGPFQTIIQAGVDKINAIIPGIKDTRFDFLPPEHFVYS